MSFDKKSLIKSLNKMAEGHLITTSIVARDELKKAGPFACAIVSSWVECTLADPPALCLLCGDKHKWASDRDLIQDPPAGFFVVMPETIEDTGSVVVSPICEECFTYDEAMDKKCHAVLIELFGGVEPAPLGSTAQH